MYFLSMLVIKRVIADRIAQYEIILNNAHYSGRSGPIIPCVFPHVTFMCALHLVFGKIELFFLSF